VVELVRKFLHPKHEGVHFISELLFRQLNAIVQSFQQQIQEGLPLLLACEVEAGCVVNFGVSRNNDECVVLRIY
jgi:hypothetical protein